MQVTVAPGSFTDGYIGQFEDKPGLGDGVWQCGHCHTAMSKRSRTGRATRPLLP